MNPTLQKVLTLFANYVDAWKERPIEMAAWLAAIVAILAICLSGES